MSIQQSIFANETIPPHQYLWILVIFELKLHCHVPLPLFSDFLLQRTQAPTLTRGSVHISVPLLSNMYQRATSHKQTWSFHTVLAVDTSAVGLGPETSCQIRAEIEIERICALHCNSIYGDRTMSMSYICHLGNTRLQTKRLVWYILQWKPFYSYTRCPVQLHRIERLTSSKHLFFSSSLLCFRVLELHESCEVKPSPKRTLLPVQSLLSAMLISQMAVGRMFYGMRQK